MDHQRMLQDHRRFLDMQRTTTASHRNMLEELERRYLVQDGRIMTAENRRLEEQVDFNIHRIYPTPDNSFDDTQFTLSAMMDGITLFDVNSTNFNNSSSNCNGSDNSNCNGITDHINDSNNNPSSSSSSSINNSSTLRTFNEHTNRNDSINNNNNNNNSNNNNNNHSIDNNNTNNNSIPTNINGVGLDPPFRCLECFKSFKRKYHLKRHLLIHTGAKPYKCYICAKQFHDTSHLKTHTLTHTGVQPYQCPVCGRRFNRNSNLRNHLATHDGGVKAYTCTVCEKGFNRKSNLVAHMNTHLKKLLVGI